MSDNLDVVFQEKFYDDWIELSQQRTSRLEHTVRGDPDYLEGKAGYFDRIGATEDYERKTRHADTQWVNTPLSRRRISLRDFQWADGIDRRDMRRFKNSGMLPNRYLNNALKAFNRRKDQLIIDAADGTAYAIDGDEAVTEVPLPSSQIIPVNLAGAGNTGLTKAKVLEAKERLDAAEVDEEEPRFALVSSKQLTNLFNITEVTSSDYNTVKALVRGEINEWMGFNWIRTERLNVDANGYRRTLFYAQGAIGMAMGEEVFTDIGVRRDKSLSTQIFVDYSGDATRLEDEKVIQCLCNEA